MSRRLVFALFLLALILPSKVEGYYNGMSASVVIGQPNFTSGSVNQGGSVGANTLNVPEEVYFDSASGKLFVADFSNNRVLIFNSVPTSSNASADVVIGQQNLTSNSANQGGSPGANTLNSPSSLAIINGKLFVADFSNHRVLIFNSIPTTNNASADVVIGQPNFTSNSNNQCSCTTPAANTLWQPHGLAINGQKLVITDQANNRVLIYNSIPTSNNVSADVVLGQTDFTTRVANQGGINANTLSAPAGLLMADNKLLIGDLSNFRVLVFNSIPTTNKASADVVIGQPNFTSNGGQSVGISTRRPFSLAYDGKRLFIVHDLTAIVSIRNSGIPTSNFSFQDVTIGGANVTTLDASHFWEPRSVTIAGNKLIIADGLHYNRVLIFDNVIATPKLNMDTPPADIGNGWLRVKGNILLGERERYKMQWVKASVNGEGASNVTNLDGGRDDGPGETRYEWYHDFTLPLDKKNEYTLKILASSFNADQSSLFFFSPFKFLSFSDGNTQTVKFSVPKTHIQSIKDNVDRFEVWSKPNPLGVWKVYVPNIPTSGIGSDGVLTYSFTKTIGGGKTDFKIVSVSKDSNWRFDSNTLTQTISGPRISGLNFTSSSNSPLQLNNVGENIVSTYNLTGVKEKYTLSSKTPIFRGIAYSNSKVTMVVTNNVTSEERTYSVKVSPDSSFTISPILFPNSTITVYLVDPVGKYTFLPSFQLN